MVSLTTNLLDDTKYIFGRQQPVMAHNINKKTKSTYTLHNFLKLFSKIVVIRDILSSKSVAFLFLNGITDFDCVAKI